MSDYELSAAEFRALYDRVKHMSRLGPADRRGALNNISPTQVVAASDIWRGRAVSLAAPIESEVAADNPDPAVHQMTHPGTSPGPASGLSFAMDRIATNIHGNADSHIDTLCHVIFDGTLYNGLSAGAVTATGDTELSIEVAGGGIVGRGLLLDIPRVRRAPWLEPGDHVTADDLITAEAAQEVSRAGLAQPVPFIVVAVAAAAGGSPVDRGLTTDARVFPLGFNRIACKGAGHERKPRQISGYTDIRKDAPEQVEVAFIPVETSGNRMR